MTVVSQKDGSFSFAKVPYGNWIVREIEAPTGFVLDDTSYEVNISENEQVVEVEITNEYIHGNIQLTKVDADYPDNKLTGATFEVYKDVNGDGKLDDGDELIGNLKETSTGVYVCIVCEDVDGNYHRLIHEKTGFSYYDKYFWNQAPNSKRLKEKADYIKSKGKWALVREQYKRIKNKYLTSNDYNHSSFICYIETVNNVYNSRKHWD